MFDAGAIEARLTINLSQFNKDMGTAEARVKRFEDGRHEVKVSAVFDNASLSKAKKAFADLDNQISRDAMQRLRSSPQGSVLGALNALFSPHPVTGGPTASQAASNGLLGKMIQSPGGGGPSVLASGNSSSTRGTSVVGDVLGVNEGSIKAQAQKAGKDAADAASNAASDEAKRRGSGWFGGLLAGIGGAVGSVFNRRGSGGTAGGGPSATAGLASNTLGGIAPGILGLSTLKATGIGLGASALGALPALIGGALPLLTGAGGLGVLALGAKQLIGSQNQSGAAPTQGPLYNQAQSALGALKGSLSTATTGLIGPLNSLFKQIPALAKSITPVLTQVFQSTVGLIQPAIQGIVSIIRQVGPGLAQAFAASGPVLLPLLKGLGALIGNLLPGMVTLLKASKPAVDALAGVFGTLGSDLGKMLAVFAPVLTQSSVLLTSLFDLIGALLPIIGKLAGIFAQALAPVFIQFSQVIQALLPFLTIIGKVLGSLAGAILGDLVSAFDALATLLKGIAPSLTIFANVLSQVFNVLENNGVFATLGDAVEALAKPLGTLIDNLIHGLVPVLPPLINFVVQLSNILAAGLAAAIIQLLPPITQLADTALQALANILPVILPLLTTLTGLFTTAFVAVIGGVADAFGGLVSHISPDVLTGIAAGILAIVGAMKLWQLGTIAVTGVTKALTLIQTAWAAITDIDTIALKAMYAWDVLITVAEKAWAVIQAALDIVLDANPIGAIVIAVAALAAGIYELYTHWGTVWGFIKKIAEDAWNFIFNGIGKYLLPLLGPAGLIAFGAIELYKHWGTIWDGIKQVASDFYTWIWTDFGAKISTFLTKTLPGWFTTAVTYIGQAWDKIQSVVEGPIKFVVDYVLDGLISVFDTITSAIGLGKPIQPVHPFGLATGGKIPGYGGGDMIPALLERGEAVIDKDRTQQWAWLFKAIGVPGFSGGGATANSGGGGGGILGTLGGILGGIFSGLTGGSSITIADVAKAFASTLGNGNGGAGGLLGQILSSVPTKMAGDMESFLVKKITSALAAAAAAAIGGGSVSIGNLSASSGYQAFVQVAKQLGWGAALLQDWVNVEMAEAGFSLTATNPSSGAYGMAQFINGPSEYYQYGGNPNTYIGQAVAMANYIIQRYGTPAGAWAHESADHWYGSGGLITEPVVGYGVNSGDRYILGENGPERVSPVGTGWGGGAGNGGLSQLADTINLMLPEGSTLADAFTELSWALNVRQLQQNWRPHG